MEPGNRPCSQPVHPQGSLILFSTQTPEMVVSGGLPLLLFVDTGSVQNLLLNSLHGRDHTNSAKESYLGSSELRQ
jgi:hypothetical protein